MRIVFLAGFFSPVWTQIKLLRKQETDNRSVIWIPQLKSNNININQFKADFHDQLAQGATDILVCLFTQRGDRFTANTLSAVTMAATSLRDDLSVRFAHFVNARDVDGIIEKLDEFCPTRETQFSADLADIESWLAKQFPQRVMLLPRALRGLKKSKFGDAATVYASISLLGREYWESRTSDPHQAPSRLRIVNEKLAALGLELGPTISESRAGEQGQEYYVNYPIGSDKHELLALHLKKGVAHDERLCLRIYFFWCYSTRRVVIGWLTSHLDTRAT